MNLYEKYVIKLLSVCEQLLTNLDGDLQEFGPYKNEAIQRNIDLAKHSIDHCLEELAAGSAPKARIIAEIALLRCEFASQVFALERIEYYLGEADYLELSPRWRQQAEESLLRMESAIEQIQNEAGGKIRR
ncbi:MAG: hypothetical protein KGS72_20345 [Cyanobacteria bacterium REEB67]|nr:hypothetical protein [Cyanobacteria bacterium REEB67]